MKKFGIIQNFEISIKEKNYLHLNVILFVSNSNYKLLAQNIKAKEKKYIFIILFVFFANFFRSFFAFFFHLINYWKIKTNKTIAK